MYEIAYVDNDLIDKTYDFLVNVKALKNVEKSILYNASVVLDNNEIIGVISYEKFSRYGLIRYFIFKRFIDEETIKKLFESLIYRGTNDNLEFFFSIILDNDVLGLFEELEFESVNKELFFIDEENIMNTKYKDATVMIKKIFH